MYIKIFESRDSSRSYTICYQPEISTKVGGTYYVTNEKQKGMVIHENDLFHVLDKLYGAELNAKS
jgi:hypothetical protein